MLGGALDGFGGLGMGLWDENLVAVGGYGDPGGSGRECIGVSSGGGFGIGTGVDGAGGNAGVGGGIGGIGGIA